MIGWTCEYLRFYLKTQVVHCYLIESPERGKVNCELNSFEALSDVSNNPPRCSNPHVHKDSHSAECVYGCVCVRACMLVCACGYSCAYACLFMCFRMLVSGR